MRFGADRLVSVAFWRRGCGPRRVIIRSIMREMYEFPLCAQLCLLCWCILLCIIIGPRAAVERAWVEDGQKKKGSPHHYICAQEK